MNRQRTCILQLMLGILLGVALIIQTPAYDSSTAPHQSIGDTFYYTFNTPGVLQESGNILESSSPYWWVNSGGELIMKDFTGSTMLGSASLLSSRWYTLYALNNSVDTDGGTHPQNIFRLVTKRQWKNIGQESQFMILADNLSNSTNRNASNGLLLMSRYADSGQTLYYAGVRVDGTAVIKKKYKGTYYTLAQQKIFSGTYTGWQDQKNLIPHNTWLTLRSEVTTEDDGSVTIKLFIRANRGDGWIPLLTANDSGQYGETPPITDFGYAGIRTDFMDVRFENYRSDTI